MHTGLFISPSVIQWPICPSVRLSAGASVYMYTTSQRARVALRLITLSPRRVRRAMRSLVFEGGIRNEILFRSISRTTFRLH